MKINLKQEKLSDAVHKTIENSKTYEISKELFVRYFKNDAKDFNIDLIKEIDDELEYDDNKKEHGKIIVMPIEIKCEDRCYLFYINYNDNVPFYENKNKIFYARPKYNAQNIKMLNFDSAAHLLSNYGIKEILKKFLFVFNVKDCAVSILKRVDRLVKSIKKYIDENEKYKDENIIQKGKRFLSIYTHTKNSTIFDIDLSKDFPIIDDIFDIFNNCGGLVL